MSRPALESAWRVYLRTQEVIGAGLLLFTVVVTLINVIMRYVFSASIVWADEAARVAFIWVTFLAGALAVAARAHLAIDTIVTKTPQPVRRALHWIANIGAFAFFALLTVGGVQQAVVNASQTSPALRIPLVYVYAAVPVCAVLMCFNLLGSTIFASEGSEASVPGPDGDIELKDTL